MLPANIKSILPAKTIDFTNPWGLSPFNSPFCLKRSEFFMLSLCEIERICKNVNSAFVKSLPTDKFRELCFQTSLGNKQGTVSLFDCFPWELWVDIDFVRFVNLENQDLLIRSEIM